MGRGPLTCPDSEPGSAVESYTERSPSLASTLVQGQGQALLTANLKFPQAV